MLKTGIEIGCWGPGTSVFLHYVLQLASHVGCQESKLTEGTQNSRLKAILFATDELSALVQARLFTVVFCEKLLRYLTGLY